MSPSTCIHEDLSGLCIDDTLQYCLCVCFTLKSSRKLYDLPHASIVLVALARFAQKNTQLRLSKVSVMGD